MKLADTKYDNHETGCCAPLDPAVWDNQTLTWTGRSFVKDHMRALFHIPLDFAKVVGRTHAAIAKAEAYPERPFWLSDEVSPWRSDFYVAVDRDVPGVENAVLSGTYLTKVFEGPYRDMGKWIGAMREHVAAQGYQIQKLYFFYATCPKCAKRFGRNQVALFAQVA